MAMNNYPIWWDSYITLYNKYTDPTTRIVSWYKTILSGCFWKRVSNKVDINNTTLETYDIVCRIPVNSKFKESSEWVGSGKYFTLNPGDIIVKGKVNDEIDEYHGLKSNDLLKKYKTTSLQIEEFSIDTWTGVGMPHYRVLGK